jgi:Kef-type K+ transport system membrane component KefB
VNPTGIEAHLTLVLLQWMIIIAVAWIFGRLGKRLGQPLTVGEILAGLLLGPSALGLIWPHHWPALFPTETQASLQLLGNIGIILLLFQVGMEFDFSHLRARSRTVVAVSLMGIIAPVIGGLCIAPWLRQRFAPQAPLVGFELYICIALSITALPIMGRILLEMRLERTALAALAVGAAAIDDVIGWVGLAVVTALVTAKFAWGPVAWQLGGLIVWLLVLHLAVGPALKWFWKKGVAIRDPSDASKMPSAFLAVLLMALFSSCLVTNKLGVFSIFGAFLLGTALHQQTDLVKAWRDQLSNFVLVALVPIFFTNTGLRTEIGSLQSSAAWLACGLVLFVGAAGKLGGCWLGARLSGQPNRDAASIAALMNTRGLMGLVAINVGYDLGLLPKELFTMFVIMSLLTTAMTGPLLKLWLPDEIRPLTPDYAPVVRGRQKSIMTNVS